MKHNELRIGNKVLYKNQVCTVDAISRVHVILEEFNPKKRSILDGWIWMR